MLIKDTSAENTIDINLTLEEIFRLSLWVRETLSSTAEFKVVGNGYDLADYYAVQIVMNDGSGDLPPNEQKCELLDYIRSCTRESNFGGERENEHWLPPLVLTEETWNNLLGK